MIRERWSELHENGRLVNKSVCLLCGDVKTKSTRNIYTIRLDPSLKIPVKRSKKTGGEYKKASDKRKYNQIEIHKHSKFKIFYKPTNKYEKLLR